MQRLISLNSGDHQNRKNKPQMIAKLKRKIQRVIGKINRDFCRRVIINFNKAAEKIEGDICSISFYNFYIGVYVK